MRVGWLRFGISVVFNMVFVLIAVDFRVVWGWREDIVSLVCYSKNHISIMVDDECSGRKWYAHGIYGELLYMV